MNRPQYILLPVNPYFIALSLTIAFLLNLLPWGKGPGVPDFIALTLLFWNLHQPRRVGISIAFALGIFMDVHNASLLGEHALAYTLLSYWAITIHRRILPLSAWAQALHLLPLLLLVEFVPFLVRLAMGGIFPGWAYLVNGFIEALIWPIIRALLLAPQKRSANSDDTRPI